MEYVNIKSHFISGKSYHSDRSQHNCATYLHIFYNSNTFEDGQRLINAREGVPNDAKIINQKRSLLLAFVETIIIKSLNE